jgi:TonB family protein
VLCALVWLSLIFPVAQVAQAQTASATQSKQHIYRIGEDGASAPIVLQKNDPKYPEEACRAAREGTVGLSLIVSSGGRAQEVKVIHPLGLGLDEAAVQAIRTWKFKPAVKDGKPVPVYGIIEVYYHLPGGCPSQTPAENSK